MQDRIIFTYDVLETFLNIFNRQESETINYEDKFISNFARILIEHYQPFINIVVNFMRKSSYDLRSVMEKENDWSSGHTVTYFKIVKLCYKITLRFYELNNNELHKIQQTKFFQTLFESNMQPHIAKIAIGYIMQVYDEDLPKLSLQFLKKTTMVSGNIILHNN